MSKSKKSYIKSKASRKLVITRFTLRALILALGVTVIYDSFVHNTPLYYILFLILGRFSGNAYKLLFSIEETEDEKFQVRSNSWNIVVTLILFAFRFLVGKAILESIHVIWATDAIYLFFIGLYYTKWKVIISGIDEIIYENLSKK
jgi:hypothetical protein